jgi:hypothetical protein
MRIRFYLNKSVHDNAAHVNGNPFTGCIVRFAGQ